MKNFCIRMGLLICIGFLGLVVTTSRVEANFNFSGSSTSDITMYQFDNPDSQKIDGKNTLRLNLKYLRGSILKVEGSFDWLIFLGDNAGAYAKIAPDGQALTLVEDTDLFSAIALRKLYLSLFFDRCAFTVGRQIINYGEGYVFSPIDRFSTIDLKDVGFSRSGSDIIRMQVPLGDLAGVEGVTAFGRSNSASAVKIFANLLNFDWSLTGIYKKPQEETLIGLTFKGDLGAGVHGELAGHYNANPDNRYFEGMLGADYSFFDSKLLLLSEYYYNGNPVDPKGLTPQQLLTLDRTFLGEHYLFTQASYAFNELSSLSLNRIDNLADGSWVGALQFSDNIFQNINLLLYARCFKGDLNGLELPNIPVAEYAIRVTVKF